jgi:3-oxoacyl-[acyl-carrier protein] reductase
MLSLNNLKSHRRTVCCPGRRHRLFAEARQAFGKIDIVVANASIEMVETPVTAFTEEQFDRLFSINTKGAYFTMQQAALNVEDNGRIIYIASGTTAFPVAGMAVYGGSKTTPRYLVDVLSKEIGYRGITVNSIIPFAVDHSGIFAVPDAYPELRKSLVDSCPMGRLAEVEDVANIAEFFASDLSSFVNGQHLLVNGGATQ